METAKSKNLAVYLKHGEQNMGLDMNIYKITEDGEEEIISLRKANQIRGYFAKLPDFKDNDTTKVSAKEMLGLYKILELLLKQKEKDGEEANKLALKYLPPTEGFFFGSNEIDEWYWEDIQETYDALSELNLTDYTKEYSYFEWY
jgi:DNA-binding PadR family transcriptional regulator